MATETKNDGIPELNCGNCKHFAQGEYSCYCSHPKQTNQARIEYCYWIHDCDLHESHEVKTA